MLYNFKSILICSLLSVSVCAIRAEKVHAPAFFELKGPVKEVITCSDESGDSSSKVSESLQFDENGAVITDKDLYVYDEAGYIVSCKSTADEPIPSIRKAIYNDDHILVGLVIEVSDPIAVEAISTHVFDEAGNVVATNTTSKLKEEKFNSIIPPCGIPDTLYTYSDIETDSYGNWIKRKLTVTMNAPLDGSNDDTLISDVLQSRTITYY